MNFFKIYFSYIRTKKFIEINWLTSEDKYRKILIEYFSKNEIVINFVISHR